MLFGVGAVVILVFRVAIPAAAADPDPAAITPSSLPQADKVIAAFKPYADVWSLVGSVGPFITAIMRAPVTTLKPEEIAAEHASNKNRCGALASCSIIRCGPVLLRRSNVARHA